MTDTITIEGAEARAAYRSNEGIVQDGRDADIEALAAAFLLDTERVEFEPDNYGTLAGDAARAWGAFVCIAEPEDEPAPDPEVVEALDDVYVYHRISFADCWKTDEPHLSPVRRMWIDIDGYGRPFISATRGQRPLSGKPIAARVRGWRKLMQPEQSIDDRAEALARIWRSIGR